MEPILELQKIANADFSSMTYKNLHTIMETISQISTKLEPLMIKKEEEVNKLTNEYFSNMLSYGLSVDEILKRIESLIPKNNEEPVEVIPEVVEVVSSLPESTNTEIIEEPISVEPQDEKKNNDSDPDNLFDNPEFKVVFNPLGKTPEPVPETIPETIPESEPEEERLQTMEELLSDDPRYQVKEPIPSLKKKQLLSMDELLTDDPINKIITMGYAKDSSYKQNDRIFHADGIIGTQTAGGQTYVYIP